MVVNKKDLEKMIINGENLEKTVVIMGKDMKIKNLKKKVTRKHGLIGPIIVNLLIIMTIISVIIIVLV
ncbi:MAG TPA: hypothetical protein VGB37_01860 [Candidatus Lokiarchaeia archaeon]